MRSINLHFTYLLTKGMFYMSVCLYVYLIVCSITRKLLNYRLNFCESLWNDWT